MTNIVVTKSGSVQGIKKTSIFSDEYISFQGIPYAQPPIGWLRFRDPKPALPWTNILDATKQGPPSWNFDPISKKLTGNEDCLHINVYTKKILSVTLKPVMVYIHGGAFLWGHSGPELYGPDYLLQKDIVFVSFNYRLGALGFLSFADPSCAVPGNAGLKDQSLALRWVKENIQNFGGDPNNVTVFGESAGGCSVNYHLSSDLSKGLFHKAIMMSGCALSPWSVVDCRMYSKRLARLLGWNGEGNDLDVLAVLQQAKPEDLALGQETIVSDDEVREHIFYGFGPCIEPYSTDMCMIPTDPLLMCRNAWGHSIPLLLGGTSEDGLYLYRLALDRPAIIFNARQMEYLLPKELNLPRKGDESLALGAKMKEFYFGKGVEPSIGTLLRLVELGTDKWFLHGLHRVVRGRLAVPTAAKTYLYRFNFDSDTFNHFRLLWCGKDVKGACHADDLSYLFWNALVDRIEPKSLELKTIQRMVEIWTKFAATGNPNIEGLNLEPLTDLKTNYKCLNIADDLSVIEYPEKKRMEFWDSLYGDENVY